MTSAEGPPPEAHQGGLYQRFISYECTDDSIISVAVWWLILTVENPKVPDHSGLELSECLCGVAVISLVNLVNWLGVPKGYYISMAYTAHSLWTGHKIQAGGSNVLS